VLGYTQAGREPNTLALDPLNNNLYVTNFGDSTVTVIPIDSMILNPPPTTLTTSKTTGIVNSTLRSNSLQTTSVNSTDTTSMITTNYSQTTSSETLNNTSSQTLSNSSSSTANPVSSSNSTELKILVSAVAVGTILMCAVFFAVRRRSAS